MPLAVSNLNLLFGLKELEEDEEDHTLLQLEVYTRFLVILYLFQKKEKKKNSVYKFSKFNFGTKLFFAEEVIFWKQ